MVIGIPRARIRGYSTRDTARGTCENSTARAAARGAARGRIPRPHSGGVPHCPGRRNGPECGAHWCGSPWLVTDGCGGGTGTALRGGRGRRLRSTGRSDDASGGGSAGGHGSAERHSCCNLPTFVHRDEQAAVNAPQACWPPFCRSSTQLALFMHALARAGRTPTTVSCLGPARCHACGRRWRSTLGRPAEHLCCCSSGFRCVARSQF